MKLELKTIKVLTSMSEETHCYQAKLAVNGKVVGTVGNAGHGGPDEQNIDPQTLADVNAFLATTFAPVELGEGLGSVPMDLEMWCGEQINEHLVAKELKTLLRSKVVYTLPQKPGLYTTKFKGVRKVEAPHFSAVQRKHPKAEILNTMPFDKALVVFQEQAA